MLNPVFRKDMRVFFRNIKVYIGMVIYLIILTFITKITLNSFISSYNVGFNPEMVMTSYLVMIGFQMLAITFVVPAFTSSSISGEIERQTLDFLLITRMTSWDIVFGKLLSSIMLVCLMIVSSMPIFAVVFYYGGISIWGFIFNTIFLIIYSAFIGSVAILFSTMLKKTVAATAVSNLFVLGLSVGTITAVVFIAGIANYYISDSDIGELILGIVCMAILSFNPIVSFMSIIDTQRGSSVVWDGIGSMMDIDINLPFIQVWHIMAAMYLVASYLILKLAAKNIRPAMRVKYKKINKVGVL